MTDSDSDRILQTITALAVDPAGTTVAVHGMMPNSFDNTVDLKDTGFIFTLDALTGATKSKLMKIEYKSAAGMYKIQSAGFLLYDDGTILMAQEFARTNTWTEPYPRLASFDSKLNRLNFIKEYDRNGHSASLV